MVFISLKCVDIVSTETRVLKWIQLESDVNCSLLIYPSFMGVFGLKTKNILLDVA